MTLTKVWRDGKIFEVELASLNLPVPSTTPPVPRSVTGAQAKIALLRAGLLAQVKTVVAAYPEEVQIWFSDAQVWERNNPYVLGIGLELSLTDDQVDDLFRAAALL